ncbi:sensor histidine kinase [Actinotalea sp.]|uniref:sensor histidine kinase n=1 Tax=Actinotalea sp. TaxID=1872145 RepID=UPI003562365A
MAWLNRADLATRLLLAIVLVVLVGGATAWVVGAAVGPGLFHEHMLRTTGTTESATEHAEVAFSTAAALSLSLALVAALAASAVVSVVLAGRIRRSLAPLASAAHQVALGDRQVQVEAPGIGPEFDDLAAAFTSMAADLSRVEETRTRMLADLAHEMRTPVSVLGGYLEAIADGVEVADAATIGMLREQVERLARLSEDVALVTTAEEGRLPLDLRLVDLDEVVREAVAQQSGAYADRGVRLTVDSGAGAVVLADPDRLGQVVTNLLDNARRHTPPEGAVQVVVERQGEAVEVAVADTGEGIAAADLPRVFERFFRVDAARDRAHGGSGIGLAIALAIARAHGGTLTAASDGPGSGARFTLRLAAAPTSLDRTPDGRGGAASTA